MIIVSIIVPAYNEQNTILRIREKISARSFDGICFEVIVVDDGSTDATRKHVSSRPDLCRHFIARAANGGKGAALKDGLNVATPTARARKVATACRDDQTGRTYGEGDKIGTRHMFGIIATIVSQRFRFLRRQLPGAGRKRRRSIRGPFGKIEGLATTRRLC